jgi:glycosyltransferase involved in cell wall biosynthesis
VDLVLYAYAKARRELGDALPPLVIAGTGPELPALRALAVKLGLQRDVGFKGQVNDVERRTLYARALVFVATAPAEPFGLVCPEAMAAGAPALVPDRGGPRETVLDGETGAIYRAGDAADLARRLVDLLARPARLRDMSDAARQHVQAHFTLENSLNSLERALSALVRE